MIKETSIFTKLILTLLPDDSYQKLQAELVNDSKLGDIIQGSGGIRKIRCSIPGMGKRGGIRVIYYWIAANDQIYMLYAYQKSKQENLTSDQIKILKNIVEEELHYEQSNV